MIAGLWLLFSDQALASLFPEPITYQQAQTYKGGLFVTVTAALRLSVPHETYGLCSAS